MADEERQEGETPQEEAPQEETPQEEQAPAPEAEKPAPESKKKEKKEEVVPGFGLDPIAIEDEQELTAEERARLEAEAEERARAEAEATADRTEDDGPPPDRKPVKIDKKASFQATGKRKSSIARVILRAGKGAIEINGREIEGYFPRETHRSVVRQPLRVTGYEEAVDVLVRVHGGGIAGQAGAVRHGIARALLQIDSELRGELKQRGLLTRDARVKERRKAGLKKARKRPQFSKR